jgi:hypothetical protein
MTTTARTPRSTARIYDGDADQLMSSGSMQDRIILVPEGQPLKTPDASPRIRLMWGQYLLDDLLAGRYRTLICAVNCEDNERGIIGQVAELLPTSQWTHKRITDHARRFAGVEAGAVIKYDMDMLEVLALLRPEGVKQLTMRDVTSGFKIAAEMVRRKPQRMPVATVSFLGAHANRLVNDDASASTSGGGGGGEPSFEAVLRAIHEAGLPCDVYPAPWMWNVAPTAVFARYPFPDTVARLREGGF